MQKEIQDNHLFAVGQGCKSSTWKRKKALCQKFFKLTCCLLVIRIMILKHQMILENLWKNISPVKNKFKQSFSHQQIIIVISNAIIIASICSHSFLMEVFGCSKYKTYKKMLDHKSKGLKLTWKGTFKRHTLSKKQNF